MILVLFVITLYIICSFYCDNVLLLFCSAHFYLISSPTDSSCTLWSAVHYAPIHCHLCQPHANCQRFDAVAAVVTAADVVDAPLDAPVAGVYLAVNDE